MGRAIVSSVQAITTYKCGCRILQYGYKTHRYDMHWCDMHANATVLVDQIRVAIRVLDSDNCGPMTRHDTAEALLAALRLAGKADEESS